MAAYITDPVERRRAIYAFLTWVFELYKVPHSENVIQIILDLANDVEGVPSQHYKGSVSFHKLRQEARRQLIEGWYFNDMPLPAKPPAIDADVDRMSPEVLRAEVRKLRAIIAKVRRNVA